MSEEMLDKLRGLEQKEKDFAASKSLTHGHINRHHKIRDKLAAQLQKIRIMDQEWDKFVVATQEKIQHHATLYRQARTELCQQYHEKLQELQSLNQEISSASQSMVQAVQGDQLPVPEVASVEDQFAILQAALQEGQRDLIPVEEMQMDTTETVDVHSSDSDKELVPEKPPMAKAKTFQASVSPNRVAHTHLKVKKEPKESKESKDK